METFVTIERAIELCRTAELPLVSEQVSLNEATGRVLSEDIASKVDDPPFDNSAMDGWAVRASDAERTEVGITTAGNLPSSINPGEAIRIMTGAPMPEGADAIIMIEDGLQGPARQHFVRKRGENLKAGEAALRAGQKMTPAAISLAATMGHATIPVQRRLRIAVISTGDELIQPGQALQTGQIHESNSYGLCALLEQIGCTAIRHPVVEDSLEGLRDALNGVDCDAILTSGGVSMGESDFVRKLMESEGDIHFWKVAMRPGGPPLFGTWNGTPLFGLPGNPVSSHVVFTTIVAPWLSTIPLTREVRVRLLDDVKGAPRKVCLRRIQIMTRGDGLVGSVHTHQGSGNIHSMVAHNGLTLLPPDTDGYTGDLIDALWLL